MTQRSTKGASKQRRDAINERISQIRDQLPVSEATRSRLSQLQVMALTNAFIAKSNFFADYYFDVDDRSTRVSENIDFTKCLPGFLLMADVTGRLLYISENVSDFLGNSAVDMVTQMDSIYDIIDKQDRGLLYQAMAQHQKPFPSSKTASWVQDMCNVRVDESDSRTYNLSFTCRMNSSGRCVRSAVGQPMSKMSFERLKTMQITGRFLRPRSLIFGAQLSHNPHLTTVFVALCTPHLSALNISKTQCSDLIETYEADTMTFRSFHQMSMRFMRMESNGEFHLGYNQSTIFGKSWYEMIHPEDTEEAQQKHTKLTREKLPQTLILRVQSSGGHFIWLHVIMQIDAIDDVDFTTSHRPMIICSNHVIDEATALYLQEQEVERQTLMVDDQQLFHGVHYPTIDSSAAQNFIQLPAPVHQENERQDVNQQLKRKIDGHLQQPIDDGPRSKMACFGSELFADVTEAPMTSVYSMPSPPMQPEDYFGMMQASGEYFGQSWCPSSLLNKDAHMTTAFNFPTSLPISSVTVGPAMTVPDGLLTPISSPSATEKSPSNADVNLSDLEDFLMTCPDDRSFFGSSPSVHKSNSVIVVPEKLPVRKLNDVHGDLPANLPELDPRCIASLLGDSELPTPSTPEAPLTSTFGFSDQFTRQRQLSGGHVVAMGNQYRTVEPSVVTVPGTCQPQQLYHHHHHQQQQQQQPMTLSTVPSFNCHQQINYASEPTYNPQLITDLLLMGEDFLSSVVTDEFGSNFDAIKPMPVNNFQSIMMSYN
jgi:hypothetical protein